MMPGEGGGGGVDIPARGLYGVYRCMHLTL